MISSSSGEPCERLGGGLFQRSLSSVLGGTSVISRRIDRGWKAVCQYVDHRSALQSKLRTPFADHLKTEQPPCRGPVLSEA